MDECLKLHDNNLQVTIWGDYGRVEGTKVFMGVAQILLDNLDLSHIVIGWYKLFGTSSLVSVPPGGGKEAAASKQALIGGSNPAEPEEGQHQTGGETTTNPDIGPAH